MSSSIQTIIAIAIVVLAATWLVWINVRKKKQSGCAGGACGAVSPEVKKLQARLKR